MAQHWKEPLDPSRHLNHFFAGSAGRRAPEPEGFSYFVQVEGFTFEFASIEQVRECLTFFEQPIHGSSRKPVFVHEKGEWQAWHERLPARVLKGSKRARITGALRNALAAFIQELQ